MGRFSASGAGREKARPVSRDASWKTENKFAPKLVTSRETGNNEKYSEIKLISEKLRFLTLLRKPNEMTSDLLKRSRILENQLSGIRSNTFL